MMYIVSGNMTYVILSLKVYDWTIGFIQERNENQFVHQISWYNQIRSKPYSPRPDSQSI